MGQCIPPSELLLPMRMGMGRWPVFENISRLLKSRNFPVFIFKSQMPSKMPGTKRSWSICWMNEEGKSNKYWGKMIQLQSQFSPYKIPIPLFALCSQHRLPSKRVPRKRTGLGISKSPDSLMTPDLSFHRVQWIPVQTDIFNSHP